MPIYEYHCAECDRSFEIFARPGHGNDGAKCPRCGGAKLVREMSTFAAHGSSAGSAAAGAEAIAKSGTAGRFTGGGGCCGGGCACH
ncbi:MAG TPA: zinc ribbon domain-containing protein [Candidatus Binataceae bacterium]|nr:zinc ribbon domain-containing protein [Candidatus Binataceae bacterium]